MPEPTGRSAQAASGFVAPADGSALRLQQLARVTSELGAARTMDDIVAAAVTHFAEAVAAAVATLMVRTDDQLVMVAGHGLQPGIEERWAVFAVDADNPASEAVRTGRPVFMGDSNLIQRRYASLKDQVPAGRSIVCLPLGSGEAPVGVVGLDLRGRLATRPE